MREYNVINEHPTKKSTRIMALIAGTGLIVLGIFIRSIYTVIVGTVIILAVIYRKELSFTEEGYQTSFDFILFRHIDLWRYSDISYIHKEPAPNRNYMGLLVQKGMAFKRAVVRIEDVDGVLELAREKNPNIHIAEID